MQGFSQKYDRFPVSITFVDYSGDPCRQLGPIPEQLQCPLWDRSHQARLSTWWDLDLSKLMRIPCGHIKQSLSFNIFHWFPWVCLKTGDASDGHRKMVWSTSGFQSHEGFTLNPLPFCRGDWMGIMIINYRIYYLHSKMISSYLTISIQKWSWVWKGTH